MTGDFKSVGPVPVPTHIEAPGEVSWSVQYDHALGAGFGANLQVTIREKDFSSLDLTANLPPSQEMGFFRTMLPAVEIDRIRALVRASNYLKYGHRGAMKPDTPTTTLREGDDVSTFIPEWPPPASVTTVFRALEAVGQEIAKHPFKVLRGEAKWTEPAVRRGEHVELTVLLRSIGTEVIAIDNPLGSASATWVGLRLTVAKDKPPEQIDWEKDVKQIDLVPQNLLTADGKLAKGQPHRIDLASGAELRFLVRRKLLLSEGNYKGSLTFIGGSDLRDGKVVGGFLTMDLGSLMVSR